MKTRQVWIDIAKFIAIFAVLVTHFQDVLYKSQSFAMIFNYSVCLFILVSGFNTYMSWSKHPYAIRKAGKKCWAIFAPYAFCAFVIYVIENRFFNLVDYLYNLVHFSVAGHHYYVLLYMQLMVLGPLMAYLVSYRGKCPRWILDVILIVVSIVIAYFTTNYTDLLWVFGGGGRLAGGTYLVLFTVGMIVARESARLEELGTKLWGVAVLCGVLLLGWTAFIARDLFGLDHKLPFGEGLNPPSLSLCVHGILIFMFLLLVHCVVQGKTFLIWLTKPVNAVAWLGRHTLYVFLYHGLFVVLVNRDLYALGGWYQRLYDIRVIRTVVIFTAVFAGSIAVEYVLKSCKKVLRAAYKEG